MAHFKILEVTLHSFPPKTSSRSPKTWRPLRNCLCIRIDQTSRTRPARNDKVTFRVDDKFLSSEDTKIVVEFYATVWVKDAFDRMCLS
ncbi:hypothetical protein V6Z11_1Z102400 [Gossypium hirsutum]